MPFPKLKAKRLKFQDLKVNQNAYYSLTITDDLVKEFSEFSRDYNSIHLEDEKAKKSIFKKRVAHGSLVSTFFSSMFANLLPGEGAILLEQKYEYLSPVFLGEEIKYQIKISKIDIQRKVLLLSLKCWKNSKQIIKGEAKILFLNS